MNTIETELAKLVQGHEERVTIDGIEFVRDEYSIHVEVDGEPQGGNYSLKGVGTYYDLFKWAKRKLVLYTGRTHRSTAGP